MKRICFLPFLTLTLCVALSACAPKEPGELVPADAAAALLDAPGVFSESLTEVDQATACALYGIDESTVESSAVYGSTGATAEELAVFALTDEDAAETAETQLGYRVEDRVEELTNYLPDELPKLENAVVCRRGNSVLLVVAADYGPVDDFLGD